jgi:hypothetical protein
MKTIEKRIVVIGFAWIVALLFAAGPAQAQDTVTNNYAAKFICGVQPDANINSNPDAQAGRYSTKINVHNNTGLHIVFRKKVIPLKGGQEPTPPFFKKIERLQPDWAMEVVCRDIYSHLNIPLPANTPPPYIEGFVIFEVLFGPTDPTTIPDDPLDVAGIYTYRGEYPVIPGHALTHGVSIDVVVYPAKRNRHVMTQ